MDGGLFTKLAEIRLGWALRNFQGSFGILDSGRVDVQYENWRGHQFGLRDAESITEIQKMETHYL